MSVTRYFSNIFGVGKSIVIGMSITMKYFVESLLFKKHTVTVQYPREMDAIPERHRGIHYLETEKCIMCWKGSDICPVDCIYTTDEDNMYYINPDECIDCAACEPVCPVTAIFAEDDTPGEWESFIDKNYEYFGLARN